MDRSWRALTRGIAAAFVLIAAWHAPFAHAKDAGAKFDPSVRPDFREPVTLASKDGVLEVRLTAKQGTARLDTVAVPVENFLVFAYELIRGTASNGQMSGDNLYPAPTLQVFPGETLIVHLDNALTGLTIGDFMDPKYMAKDEEVPLYPAQMTSSPINLHIHGVHVSPKGNADNVMLHIPPGMSNTYTYHIPKSMPQGAYWYHSHLHTLTAAADLSRAGWPSRDRAHRRQPSVGHGEPHPHPQHGSAIQLRVRPGRRPCPAQQLHLAAMGQHDQAAARRRAGEGHLSAAARLRSTSRNRKRASAISPSGTRARCRSATSAGAFEFIPSNLQRFTASRRQPGKDVPADPSLPDYQARPAIHREWPVSTGDQEQSGADRDLGARQCQRHRLHARRSSPRRRPAITPRSPSSARTGCPIRKSIIPSSRTARSCSFRRRPAMPSR